MDKTLDILFTCLVCLKQASAVQNPTALSTLLVLTSQSNSPCNSRLSFSDFCSGSLA